MICTSAAESLQRKKLNESQEQNSKYILEGIFAELGGKPNRNGRIYTKEEYLKHLAYLREDIKKGEPLLGELDHPDDRFEVKLKEASHRIIDLWYDASKNVVMGKIELLNTPNGKLAQSIVDQGIPLHISSRAAGSVNADNTVQIQQIYTYDLVCKPGFAGAVLHRVNESADAPVYTDDVKSFLQNSVKSESLNAAAQYGFINEDMDISEIKANANLRNEAKNIQINKQMEINVEEMSRPLYENTNPDQTLGKPLDVSGNGAETLGIPVAIESDESEEDVKKSEASDDTSKEDTSDEKSEKSADDKDDKETEEKTEEKENSGIEIIEVKAEFDETANDDIIQNVEAEFGDDEEETSEDKSKEETEEKDEPAEEEEKQDECDNSDVTVKCSRSCDKDSEGSTDKLYDCDKAKDEAEELSDKVKKDIDDRSDKLMKKLDDLRAAIEKKSKSKEESKNESVIMAQYPASMMLNESNFAQFAGLTDAQKNKVTNYLRDNNITDRKSINENWKNGVNYVAEIPVWLKYAPENYKALYEAAEPTVKKSIETTASYLLFENQQDVNSFWENSGLQAAEERRILNESFVNTLPKVTAQPQKTSLPYSRAYIDQITAMACEYNKK